MNLLWKYYFTLALLVVSSKAFTQLSTRNWVFGTQIQLNFDQQSNVTASFKSVPLSTSEGSSCISDDSGNLILYTDGRTIWNGNNKIVSGGTGLKAYETATQTSLIIKRPNSDSLYYVFTNNIEEGLFYSEVDITANSGDGIVIKKNIQIAQAVNEKITACVHADGKSIWVISHTLEGDKFLSFQVTEFGINEPVTSRIGHYYSGSDFVGCLKASPNGRFLANAIYPSAIAELLYFDNSTGEIYEAVTLSESISGAYGAEFSRDNSKVLISSWVFGSVYVFDVSKIIHGDVSIDTVLTSSRLGGSLQLALDSNIYLTGYKNIGQIVIGNGKPTTLNDTFIKIPDPYNPSYGTPNFNPSVFYIPSELDTVSIPRIHSDIIYVPTAFSPNNDGLNDYLTFEQYNFSFFSLQIFNRWGQLVYSSQDGNDKFFGEGLPQSQYIVLINYSIGNESIKKFRGTLYLLRN